MTYHWIHNHLQGSYLFITKKNTNAMPTKICHLFVFEEGKYVIMGLWKMVDIYGI
jgi:hypothetical protein